MNISTFRKSNDLLQRLFIVLLALILFVALLVVGADNSANAEANSRMSTSVQGNQEIPFPYNSFILNDDLISTETGHEQYYEVITELSEQSYSNLVVSGKSQGEDANLYDSYVLFSEKPPAEILQKFSGISYRVQIRYGAPLDTDEINRISFLAIEELQSIYPEISSAASDIDYDTFTISILYSGAPQISDPDISDSIVKNISKTEPAIEKIQLKYFSQTDRDVSEDDANVRGGRQLRRSNDIAHCTSGFASKRNGVKGVMSAAHCGSQMKYGYTSGVISYVTKASLIPYTGRPDLNFYKTLSGHSTTGTFFQGTKWVTVTGNRYLDIGDSVCKYGMTTGRTCSNVRSRHHTRSSDGETYAELIALEGSVTAPGDSGGPWFVGGKAVGVHSGRIYVGTLNPKEVSVYTPVTISNEYMSTKTIKS